MADTPKVTILPEADRDPELGIDADGGPLALRQGKDDLPDVDENGRDDDVDEDAYFADPEERQVAYRIAPGGTIPDGFIVAVERHLEDGTISMDGPAVASFTTKEEAEAEADRLNQIEPASRL
jgi:hypothetical protein